MNLSFLATVNALLNLTSGCLLTLGFIAIKSGNPAKHRKLMVSALVSSTLFLISYLIYHAQVGSVPYSRHDWTRDVYFAILIPHVIFAGLILPFIVLAVRYALKEQFTQHRRLVRWIWPVWMFVSVSGVIVYLMLYHL